MRWNEQDAKTFNKAKDYVDTALIPLIPLEGGKQLEDVVKMGEFTNYLTDFLERQYTGRVFLLPPFTYLREESAAEKYERLKNWTAYFEKEGFKHFMFVTADMKWREIDAKAIGELIWVPAFSMKDMDSSKKMHSIAQQAEQIIPIMTEKWK